MALNPLAVRDRGDQAAPRLASAPARRRSPLSHPVWLLLPALLVLAAIFILPVGRLAYESFTQPDLGIDRYRSLLADGVTTRVLVRTLIEAAVVTAVTLVLGFPYAYVMSKTSSRMRPVMVALVLMPLWISLMARTFAWVVLLQQNGPVNDFLRILGLGPVALLHNNFGVILGTTQLLLPFMVLPLYLAMYRVDVRLLDAARTMGAPPRVAFRSVFLPLAAPGVYAGCLLVYILAIGFYVTPQILGNPQQALIAVEIGLKVNALADFPAAGALAVILLVATLLLLASAFRMARLGNILVRVEGQTGQSRVSRKVPPWLWGTSGIVGLLLIAPTLVVVPLSFTDRPSFAFPPPGWSLRYYERFFSDPAWYGSLLNSLPIAIAVAVLATTLGTAAAFALERGRFRGRPLLQTVILAPLIVPQIVTAVAIYIMFLHWHLIGTFAGYVLAHTVLALPLVVINVGTALRGLDGRLDLAAASLGAGPWARLRYVTMPLILPGVLSAAAFAFVISFDEVIVSIFIQSPTLQTLPVEMYASVSQDIDPTMAAASSMILVTTTALILLPQLLRRRARPDA